MKRKAAVLLLSILAIACTALAADKAPVGGGEPMYSTKDIIDNAVNSAAVKAAGLVDTLKGPGHPQLRSPKANPKLLPPSIPLRK